jgi:DNA-binding response OmpR family regulator
MAGNPTTVIHSPILWIEGRWSGSQDFVSLLRKKGFVIETVPTGKQALSKAGKKEYDLLIINAASMRTSGARICKSLNEKNPDLPIILICSPDRVASGVGDYVGYQLVLEFTTRKLVNRIMKLLPGVEANMIRKGPIVIDPDRNIVSCNGQQTTLTPRLYSLLELFIANPGKVVPRETLFKEVWKTSYTGDTRTLDVHISWLRQAIEKDPRNPKLLQTIRGVGYKLNV